MLIDIPETFQDEFGEVDAEVWRAAQNLSAYSRRLALKILNDEARGQTLLMRAAALVSEKITAENSAIEHLPAYLLQTFRRLVFAEARKSSLHQELEEKYFESLEDFFRGTADSEETKICRRLLIEEIVGRMDSTLR